MTPVEKPCCSSKMLKIKLPCGLAIPLSGRYLKECKSGYNKDTCTPMWFATLFKIAKLRKKKRCPITDEGI
jgi:hypothetical protein